MSAPLFFARGSLAVLDYCDSGIVRSRFSLAIAARSRRTLATEDIFLPEQPALFQEREVKPRRANDCKRWMLATLSRMFDWRKVLWNVKPDTLISWHRKVFWLCWWWKSTPPAFAQSLRRMLREMACVNGFI